MTKNSFVAEVTLILEIFISQIQTQGVGMKDAPEAFPDAAKNLQLEKFYH